MTARSRLFVLLAAVVAMLAIDSVPAAAQEARGGSAPARGGAIPRRPDGKPDLTGRWNGSAGQIAYANILEEHTGGFGINAGKSEERLRPGSTEMNRRTFMSSVSAAAGGAAACALAPGFPAILSAQSAGPGPLVETTSGRVRGSVDSGT